MQKMKLKMLYLHKETNVMLSNANSFLKTNLFVVKTNPTLY